MLHDYFTRSTNQILNLESIFFVAEVAVGDVKVLPCSQRNISPTD